MNNKEKRAFISDSLIYNSTAFPEELINKQKFINSIPTILYKYRKFDKYAFEMIKDNYVYLTPVKGLDDPFDCFNDFTIDDLYNKKTGKITKKALDVIISFVYSFCDKTRSKEEMKKIVYDCMTENGIDYEKAPKIVTQNGNIKTVEIEPFFIALNSFEENLKNVFDSSQMDGFAKSAYSPGDAVGVFSLSENRDNKVMWSLYGKNYEGYCIEYEIPRINDVINNLCPVIYTKKNNNRYIEKMLEYTLSALMRAITGGKVKGNLGAAMELFCTKDKDWSFQDEWRLIGSARDHCGLLKIKAIYLGFKVKKTNELRMKALANKYGFSLYKMNAPSGKKRITYCSINNL